LVLTPVLDSLLC